MLGELILAFTAIALLIVAYGRKYHPSNDITTSPDLLLPLKAPKPQSGHNRAVQSRLYPGLAPLVLAVPLPAASARAVSVARSMGWSIESAEEVDRDTFLVYAVDTTKFWRFKDDVVVRVKRNENGVVVDVRSKSRVGKSDFGKNISRVNAFLGKMKA